VRASLILQRNAKLAFLLILREVGKSRLSFYLRSHMFEDLKKKPVPSKSEGKKGMPGGKAFPGTIPPTKIPTGGKKPAGTSTSKPGAGSNYKPTKGA
jgi:hypothetical protein